MTPEEVRSIFDREIDLVEKASKLAEKERDEAEASLLDVVAAWYAKVFPKLRAWALARLAEQTSKVDPDPPDLGGLPKLADDVSEALRLGVSAGSKAAYGAIGIELGEPPPAALAYAEERGAELVGMKRTSTGELIPNPNAEWRIDDALREDVRDLVTQAIDEGWSTRELGEILSDDFTAWRSKTIARTETGFAYGNGAHSVYEENGVEYVRVLDGFGCLPDGHDDEAERVTDPIPGIVEDGKQADGQIWTLAQYGELVLGHPNCVRAAVPYVASVDRVILSAEAKR